MKTLILCDRQSMVFFTQDLGALVREAVEDTGNKTTVITLNGDELSPCLGCFQCWVKTPGLCIITNDSANSIVAQLIQADVVILLSEIFYGGFSYDIKALLDRSISLISPYFETYEGEMHHKKRYEHFPVLIAIGYGGHMPEEYKTFKELAYRNALNLRPTKYFTFTIQDQNDVGKTMQMLHAVLTEEVQK